MNSDIATLIKIAMSVPSAKRSARQRNLLESNGLFFAGSSFQYQLMPANDDMAHPPPTSQLSSQDNGHRSTNALSKPTQAVTDSVLQSHAVTTFNPGEIVLDEEFWDGLDVKSRLIPKED
jgi:hypothetical protein